MNTITKVNLFFKEGSSDKEYGLQLVEATGGYLVNFQYGRRGSTLTPGTKTPTPVDLATAQKIYDKKLKEQLSKGYKPGDDTGTYISVAGIPEAKDIIFLPQLLNDIEESDIEKYLRDDKWGGQEKKDGHHQAFHKKSGKIIVSNKKGTAIGFPEALKKAIKTDQDLTVDAESIGEVFHAFDLIEGMGQDLRNLSYEDRYTTLKGMFKMGIFDNKNIVLVPLAIGYAEKKAMYDKLKAEKREGMVFKRLDAKHTSGRPASGGNMLKCKFYAELSARVAAGREGKRSFGLELLDEKGVWIKMGNCTVPPDKNIPAVSQIVEIRYLYANVGGSLYQPFFKELRDDVDESECLMKQVKYKPVED